MCRYFFNKYIGATTTDTYEAMDSGALFASTIKKFLDVTLPEAEVASLYVSRITDDFQILKPASSR